MTIYTTCGTCEVPTEVELTLDEDLRITHVDGGEISPDGLVCDGCLGSAALAAIVAGGAR